MNKSALHKNLHFYLCCAIAFLISFKLLVPVIIILLVVNWLSEGNFKTRFTNIESKAILLLFIAPYLLYLVGMSYTTNIQYGLADLQTKLSLLLFPLIFATTNWRPSERNSVLMTLLIGVVSASLFLVMRACYFYFSQGLNYFFYVDFSFFLHPSYFGLAVNLVILLLLSPQIFKFSIYLKALLLAFLVVIIFLLSSKLALLSTVFIFIGFGIHFIVKTGRYKTGTALLLLTIGSTFVLIKSIPELEARIQNTLHTLSADNIDKSDSESNAVRVLVWHAAADAFKQNGFLGVGTGDVKDELFKQYETLGYTGALEHKLNAHNQFLQTGVALGYIGFAVLLTYFFIPIVLSWKQKNYLFLAFSLIVILNCLTESMLEAEAGVIFISFFQSFLFFRKEI